MTIEIRAAAPETSGLVSSILNEAAAWLTQRGMPMWRASELSVAQIAADVSAGLFFLAWAGQDAAGTIKFQMTDPMFWPDCCDDQSVFVHRLAVRRGYAGQGVSAALLRWAADRGRALHRRSLKLDCEASRLRLRQMYEDFGFIHADDRQVGPYLVARYALPLEE